jgi:hypothetical protein
LTFSSETWTLAKKQTQETGTVAMKFLRNVAGYLIKDLIRNNVIRNELNIFNLNNRITEN